jgi:Family of unknown function (DUF6427)
MITTIFKKSTPINYILVAVLMIVFFLLYQFNLKTVPFSYFQMGEKLGLLFVLLSTIFVTDFVTKKNGLSKDSGYTVFFGFLYLVFFPSILNEPRLILANFFILLALRRLISLQTLKSPKEKIFDASLWIFVATLFHFWSILFVFLVFISIFFHVSRDYRNWVLPFIAFFSILIIFALSALIFDKSLISNLLSNISCNYQIDYFENNFQNIALSLYVTIAIFFLASMVMTLSHRPLILNSSYKKLFAWFFIGIIIYIISPNKNNGLLLFTFAPLAILSSSHIEYIQIKWQKEIVLFLIMLCSFFGFFSQL